MTADERRLRRRYTLGMLRPEARTARPSRGALVADALLAAVLTVAAVFAATGFQSPDRHVGEGPHPVFELLQLPSGLRASPPALPLPPPLPALPPPGGSVGTRSPEPVRPAPPAEAGPDGYGPPLLLVVLTASPLAARRRYPLTTFWVVLSATLATNGGETWITVLTCAIAAYSAIAHSRNRVPAVAGILLAAVLAGAVDRDIVPSLPSWLGPYVILLSAGALASFVRFWRHSRSRLAELQQAQEDAMRKAVQAERSRIASELHDVVTHNVSVMVIQAGAARKVMDMRPEQSKEALIAIEASGRAAMAELRNVMGLLAGPESGRSDGSGDGLEPQPGLDQLDGLIERVRAAGVAVDVKVSPPRGPLPPGVDLAVYRVVQEALTNTMKHAVGAAASVAIGHDGDFLEIEVTDTGGTQTARSRSGDGRGLIGLRERLALYGGTLDATRGTGGGYRLRARIPWRAA
ncbi:MULTISPECIES: sensor histidine kinase [Streptosporangium]|uniref:histidine kinase n=1 Tax=Streptosporangium brasiliense TaxID=47480 RepID=A0ABT9RLX9_9ACTN|nr:histidine kinase [Streptosporangium brasiliense]MDP9869734.1 signal transduction histidine kinase [Streptosporangium brasiliense]